ncbi:hypothetical protein [Actinoplanes sp. NBRC 101535]|uniref:hypothetical protein n=1 Tax=Actinoplanes sp. NBRC 101535 TaxID=3032196 RepID=UPI0024A3DF9B|nr:hypothetical protein [Actinoplanes sp. NBRC 101535]GLY00623.1 hypothetical protein Acsp01_10020 [Actinoplanes sp. NBRC 101535]
MPLALVPVVGLVAFVAGPWVLVPAEFGETVDSPRAVATLLVPAAAVAAGVVGTLIYHA